jgi:hypothetical protein
MLIAVVALTAAHHSPRLLLSNRAAVAAVMHDRAEATELRGTRWDQVRVSALDGRLERVSFYAGPRIVAEVAIRANGTVQQAIDFHQLPVPYGDWLAYEPSLLLGLGVLFVLMAAVAPVRRLRNLDVVAVLSLLAPAVLLQHRYLDASVLSAVPGMGYLMLRCARHALGSHDPPAQPATPLFEHLTASWGPRDRVRILRWTLAAVALVFVMVGVSSPDAVDVVYAVMEGATKLIHGVLPYGHMPGDVIHGDTYPILSYALYTPLAWLAPVTSTWDAVDGALAVTVLAGLACAATLFRAVAGPTGGRGKHRAPEAELAGLRAALTLLAFPPLLIIVSTGTTDVVLGLLLALALVTWRRPTWSATLLAAGGWFKLAPFVLVPMWLAPLRGRRLLKPVAAIGAVSIGMLLLVVGVGGAGGLSAMVRALSYQFSRGSPQSVWSVLGIEALQPIAQASVLALVAGAAMRVWRDPELAGDRARVAALSAAILLGLQLSADYWAFLYVAWIAPLISLSLFPELARARAPVPVAREADRSVELVPALAESAS